MATVGSGAAHGGSGGRSVGDPFEASVPCRRKRPAGVFSSGGGRIPRGEKTGPPTKKRREREGFLRLGGCQGRRAQKRPWPVRPVVREGRSGERKPRRAGRAAPFKTGDDGDGAERFRPKCEASV